MDDKKKERVKSKLEQALAYYLMSGRADNDMCKEWREVLEVSIKAVENWDDQYRGGYEDGGHDGYAYMLIEDGKEEKYFGKSYIEL